MHNNLIPHFIEKKYYAKQYSGAFYAKLMVLDIIGFTALTEKFMQSGKEGAEKLSKMLNLIYEPIIKLIYHYHGEVVSFAGDAISAIFEDVDDQESILRCSSLISQIFSDFNDKTNAEKDLNIAVKIGLAFDKVTWNIYEQNNHATFLFESPAISNALKAQNLSKKNQIIAHKSLYSLANNQDAFGKEDFTLIEYKTPELLKSYAKTRDNISEKIKSLFFPMLKGLKNVQGEFRNIVSVFINFKSNDQHNNLLIESIIELSDLYGAYLNKLDSSDNANMALLIFGAPQASENDIQRALAFCNDLRNKYHKQIKIGLSSGIAYAGMVGSNLRSEYTCLGDTLNISARLMSLAEWGKVWLTKSVINKNANYFNLIKLQEQYIKGKKDSVSIFELAELKNVNTEFYPGNFCGRDKELSQLNSCLTPLYRGKSAGVVYLYGEAGSGKSRLIYEFITKFNDEINMIHFYTDNILRKSLNPIKNFLFKYFKLDTKNSEELQNNIFEMNYSLLLNRLANVTDKRKEEFFSDLIYKKDYVKHLLEIKVENPYLKLMNPKDLFDVSLFTLKNLFLAMSMIKKTCLIVEDIQWLDHDTKLFLEVLSRTCEHFPLLIVLTGRYGDDGSKEKLNLNTLTECEMNLETLKDSDVNEMVESLLLDQISQELLAFIIDKTENNPFFVEQFCLYLKDEKLIKLNKHKYELVSKKMELPNNINAIIISRIDRLSSELKDIIQIASVLGREFDVRLLNDMLSCYYSASKYDSFSQKFKEIEQQQIWVILKQLRYIFRHVLIQEAIYEMQLHERLKVLHLIAAKSMEKLYNNRDELFLDIAYHYEKANRKKKAKLFYIKAAKQLAYRYDNEKAIQAYQKALNLGLTSDDKFSVVYNLAKVLDIIGNKKAEEELLISTINEAVNHHNNYHIMRLKTLFGNLNRSLSNYEIAMENLNHAKLIAEELKDQKEISDITGFIGIVYLHTGKLEEAMASFEYKRFICETMGDRLGVGYSISNMGVVHLRRSEYDLAMQCYQSMESISLEENDKSGLILALGNMAIIWYNKGAFDKAIDCLDREIKFCNEIGDKNKKSNAYNNLGNVYWSKGEIKKALKCYEYDKKICEELGDKKGLAYAIGNMGLIHYMNDDLNKAIKSFKYWAEVCESFHDNYGTTTALSNLGLAYWDNGDFEHSMACFEKNKEICENIQDHSQLSLTIGNMGSIYMEKGDFKEALKCINYRLEIVEKIGETLSLSICYLNLASIYSELEEASLADQYYNMALVKDKETENEYHYTNALCEYAIFLYEKADYIKCKNIFYQAYENILLSEDQEIVEKMKILEAKLIALDDPKSALSKLIALNNDKLKKNNQALLYYEIWMINKDKNYHDQALDLYKKLYQKVPKYSYQVKINKLG